MSHIRPFQGLGFSSKGRYPPSPNGATPFQRKGAPALRHAALETQRGKDVTLGSFLRKELGEALRNTENRRCTL